MNRLTCQSTAPGRLWYSPLDEMESGKHAHSPVIPMKRSCDDCSAYLNNQLPHLNSPDPNETEHIDASQELQRQRPTVAKVRAKLWSYRTGRRRPFGRVVGRTMPDWEYVRQDGSTTPLRFLLLC